MRISDWSSDVCSSDLEGATGGRADTVGPDHHVVASATAVVEDDIDAGAVVLESGRTHAETQSRTGLFRGVVEHLRQDRPPHPDRRREVSAAGPETGRASVRGGVCKYVSISGGD